MADITLSRGIRQNLLALQSTAELLGRTQNRLSTGRKVNSAIDNPGSFFVSQGLTARASDLATLLDGIGQAVQVLQAADKGISSLTSLIQNAQATARTALQAASSTAKVQSSQTYTDATALVGAGATQFQAGDAFVVTVGAAAPQTFTLTAAGGALDTVGELIAAINANAVLNPPGAAPLARAYLDEGGKLVVEAVNGQNLTIALTDAGAANTLGHLFGTGVDAITETGSAPRTATPNAARTSAAAQYNLIKNQIDQLVKDTGYNGTNLINGQSLKVIFNETSTTSLTIVGVTLNSTGLGLSSSDTINNWQSDNEINASLTKLQAALFTLRSQAAAFGSNLSIVKTRQDLTNNMIKTLEDGSDALVVADQNEEGANLLALQTRQQLSTTALSLASQADQAILRLFG